MKKAEKFLLFTVLVFLQACQFLPSITETPATATLSPTPSRTGTVISDCGTTVAAIDAIQPTEIPKHLLETGVKQGSEFDANSYFDVLTHLSMREGYVLDYVYSMDSMGAQPMLYARPVDQPPYTSGKDVTGDAQSRDLYEHLEVEDVEVGYFEYIVMTVMAKQFYQDWHANYNDWEIVCSRQAVEDIIARVNSSDFGSDLDPAQQNQARAIEQIEPVVDLSGEVAEVQFVVFTKWGGFIRLTYKISREFPHKIIEVEDDELVPYDCGVMF